MDYFNSIRPKQLLTDQFQFYKQNLDNDKISKSYDKFCKIYSGPKFNNPQMDKLTLGRIVYLFQETKLFDCIELRLNSRLTNTKRMPWNFLKGYRNHITHSLQKANREKALDFLQYSKVFLIESQIAPEIVSPAAVISCYQCHHNIDPDWKYCPHCGASLQIECNECNTKLKPEWVICPKCKVKPNDPKIGKSIKIYRQYCKAIWADGYLNSFEKVFLNNKRQELFISKEKALEIEQSIAPHHAVIFKSLVEATLIDKKIDENEKEFLRNKAISMDLSVDITNSVYNACYMESNSAKLFDTTREVNILKAS